MSSYFDSNASKDGRAGTVLSETIEELADKTQKTLELACQLQTFNKKPGIEKKDHLINIAPQDL